MMSTPRRLWEQQQTASNRTPRQINRNLIFNQIRTMQPISRADLARSSGLQRSTVSLIVEELLAENWIVEDSIGNSPRGRKPTFLVINRHRVVLALDVHPAQTTLAVTDLSGRIFTEKRALLPDNSRKVIGAILDAVRKMIAAHDDRTFEGIGITLPGRFSHQLKKTIFAPNVGIPRIRITNDPDKTRLRSAVALIMNEKLL